MSNVRSIAKIMVGVSCLVVLGVSVVYADFNVDRRMYRSSSCTPGDVADPINLLFWNFGDTNCLLKGRNGLS